MVGRGFEKHHNREICRLRIRWWGRKGRGKERGKKTVEMRNAVLPLDQGQWDGSHQKGSALHPRRRFFKQGIIKGLVLLNLIPCIRVEARLRFKGMGSYSLTVHVISGNHCQCLLDEMSFWWTRVRLLCYAFFFHTAKFNNLTWFDPMMSRGSCFCRLPPRVPMLKLLQ